MSGYIYCFSNQSLDGIYKIGFTTRDIISRLSEMNRPATHRLCDDIYKIEFAKKINDCRETEKIIHTVLETLGARLYPNREFFKISLPFIKSLFNLYEGQWYDNKCVIKNKLIVTNSSESNYTICEKTNDTEENVEMIKKSGVINLVGGGITCSVCLKSYKTRTTFNRHICKDIDNSTICKFCNREFKTKYNRIHHETRCGDVTTVEKLVNNKTKRFIK
jgi:hypothetical protein